jgi:hypothetical protein
VLAELLARKVDIALVAALLIGAVAYGGFLAWLQGFLDRWCGDAQ